MRGSDATRKRLLYSCWALLLVVFQLLTVVHSQTTSSSSNGGEFIHEESLSRLDLGRKCWGDLHKPFGKAQMPAVDVFPAPGQKISFVPKKTQNNGANNRRILEEGQAQERILADQPTTAAPTQSDNPSSSPSSDSSSSSIPSAVVTFTLQFPRSVQLNEELAKSINLSGAQPFDQSVSTSTPAGSSAPTFGGYFWLRFATLTADANSPPPVSDLSTLEASKNQFVACNSEAKGLCIAGPSSAGNGAGNTVDLYNVNGRVWTVAFRLSQLQAFSLGLELITSVSFSVSLYIPAGLFLIEGQTAANGGAVPAFNGTHHIIFEASTAENVTLPSLAKSNPDPFSQLAGPLKNISFVLSSTPSQETSWIIRTLDDERSADKGTKLAPGSMLMDGSIVVLLLNNMRLLKNTVYTVYTSPDHPIHGLEYPGNFLFVTEACQGELANNGLTEGCTCGPNLVFNTTSASCEICDPTSSNCFFPIRDGVVTGASSPKEMCIKPNFWRADNTRTAVTRCWDGLCNLNARGVAGAGCILGATGPACGANMPGFYFRGDGSVSGCPEDLAASYFLVIMLCLLVITFVMVCWWLNVVGSVKPQSKFLPTLKVLFSYWILLAFSIDFNSGLRRAFQTITLDNRRPYDLLLDPYWIECTAPRTYWNDSSFFTKLIWITVFPFLVAALGMAVVGIDTLLKHFGIRLRCCGLCARKKPTGNDVLRGVVDSMVVTDRDTSFLNAKSLRGSTNTRGRRLFGQVNYVVDDDFEFELPPPIFELDDDDPPSNDLEHIHAAKARSFGVHPAMVSWIMCWLVIGYVFYPFLLSTHAKMFRCQRVSGTSYLIADMQIECGTSAQVFSIVTLILVGIGFPIAAFFSIRHVNNKLSAKHAQYLFGILTKGFHTSYWWWELGPVSARKFLFALLLVVASVQPLSDSELSQRQAQAARETARSALALLVLFFSLLANSQLHPYAPTFRDVEFLESLSLSALAVQILIGLTFSDIYSNAVLYVISISIYLLSIAFSLYCLHALWKYAAVDFNLKPAPSTDRGTGSTRRTGSVKT